MRCNVLFPLFALANNAQTIAVLSIHFIKCIRYYIINKHLIYIILNKQIFFLRVNAIVTKFCM